MRRDDYFRVIIQNFLKGNEMGKGFVRFERNRSSGLKLLFDRFFESLGLVFGNLDIPVKSAELQGLSDSQRQREVFFLESRDRGKGI